MRRRSSQEEVDERVRWAAQESERRYIHRPNAPFSGVLDYGSRILRLLVAVS